MKVLLINPLSPESFWSLAQEAKFTGSKTVFPPLGLLTVAALLPKEWEVRLVDINCRKILRSDWEWADTIFISGMLVQKNSLLECIATAKKLQKKVVVGGPYATSMPDEVIMAGCDILVRGEIENTITELLHAVENHQQGIIQNGKKPDLTKSPLPRFDLLNFNDYSTMGIQVSRGCPHDCEFCDIVNLYGRHQRYKTPSQIIAELDVLYKLGWRHKIFICDDNFIGKKTIAKSILREIIPWMKSHGEPFSFMTQASVNLAQDLELIDLMTEANFDFVFLGIESPDENVLELSNKRQNVRNPISESIETIKKNGLTVIGSFIIGLDGEKKGTGERICKLIDETSMPIAMLNILQILPNTRLWSRLESEGRLCSEKTSGETTAGTLNYVPSRPESEILDEFWTAWNYIYDPPRYLKRTMDYYLGMRPTRRVLAKDRGEIVPVNNVPKAKPSIRRRLFELQALLRLVWRQGIMPSYRMQFWKQLIQVWRKNPSRLARYLGTCGFGENLFRFSSEIDKRTGLNDKNRNL